MLRRRFIKAKTNLLNRELYHGFFFILNKLFDRNMFYNKVVMRLKEWFWLEFYLIFGWYILGMLWLQKLLGIDVLGKFLKLIDWIIKIE